MHDLGRFRANLDAIAERLSTRGLTLPLEEFRELDKSRRRAITDTEQLQAQQNALSREIFQLRKEGADAGELQRKSRLMGDRVAELAKEVEAVDAQFREMLAGIPNVPHESVPMGKSAEDNVVIRTSGEPGRYDFVPKAHWDLGPELGILDFDRAAKITGARGWARNWSGH
jgi:seryl-tRNA synthetase